MFAGFPIVSDNLMKIPRLTDGIQIRKNHEINTSGKLEDAASLIGYLFSEMARGVCHLLASETSFEVSIPVGLILKIVEKTTRIPLRELVSKKLSYIISLTPVIISLKKESFEILECLIQTCGTVLASETRVINRLIISTLTDTIGMCNPRVETSGLESSLYSFLYVYCSRLGSLTGFIQTDMTYILRVLQKYIHVEQKVVKLRTPAVNTPKTGKGKRKKSGLNHCDADDVLDSESEAKISVKDLNLYQAGLKVLNTIIIRCDMSIGEDGYKCLVNSVVTQLLDVYRKKENNYGIFTIPECRYLLLSVLRSLITCPKFPSIRPLEPALVIFTEAVKWETDVSLINFSSECLNTFSLIVHPVVPVRFMRNDVSNPDLMEISPEAHPDTSKTSNDSSAESFHTISENGEPGDDDDDDIQEIPVVANGSSEDDIKCLKSDFEEKQSPDIIIEEKNIPKDNESESHDETIEEIMQEF